MDSTGRWSEETKYITARTLFLSLVPIFIWNIDYHATDRDFSFCLFKMITGHCCYGCGLLRGISALLHGDYREALRLNRLNALTIPLLAGVYLREWRDACRPLQSTNKLGPSGPGISLTSGQVHKIITRK